MKYLSPEAEALAPYTPGEQPKDQAYVKLNTNESPFPPSPKVLDALTRAQVEQCNLYPDPLCTPVLEAVARHYGLSPENIIAGNGSDEILAFAFRAFCGTGHPVAYADVTYSFYEAQTALFGLSAQIVPLREDFSLCTDDYMNVPGTVVIANPNAPTGMAVPVSDIRRLAENNPERVVIVDEAYVDFGAESCVNLIGTCENVLVVQTFSKSRSLAGGRIGFAMGSRPLIDALNRVKFSFNPYNVNRLSILAGAAALDDQQCQRNKRQHQKIQQTRAWTTQTLQGMGFTVLPSQANFVFASRKGTDGGELYRRLKANGVLVRWFNAPRLRDYLRISIGSPEQMETFASVLRGIV